MTQRNRPSRTVTLAADLWQKLELEASLKNFSVSQLVEAHLLEYYEGGPTAKLDRLESLLTDVRSSVLPVAAKVARYLQQLEGDVPAAADAAKSILKVASAEEMYGEAYGNQPARIEEPHLPAPPPNSPARRWKPW